MYNIHNIIYLLSKLLNSVALNHSTCAIQIPLNLLTDFSAMILFPRFRLMISQIHKLNTLLGNERRRGKLR